MVFMTLTNEIVHANISPAWQGSSVVEQETHKLLVVGSTPTLATPSGKRASHRDWLFGWQALNKK
jgi:hypothetical protein